MNLSVQYVSMLRSMRLEMASCLLFSLFCPFNHASAQDFPWEKPNVEDTEYRLLLRGKILPFVIIEDAYIVNATLGAEIKVKGRHSLGCDFIANKLWYERDSTDAATGEELGYGHFQNELRYGLLLDYRYYFIKRKDVHGANNFYISSNFRMGKIWFRSCPDFTFSPNDDMTKDAYFRDLGLALGWRTGGYAKERWGVDINVGVMRRYKSEDYQRYLGLNEIGSVWDRETIRWSPSLRFNVCYHLIQPT